MSLIPNNTISNKIYGFIYLTRPFNGVTVMLAFSVAYFFYSDSVNVEFLFLLISLFLVHSATTVQNDYYDLQIDKTNSRDGLLIEGKIKLSEVKVYYYLLNFVAIGLSLFTSHAIISTSTIVVLMMLGTLYNARPFFLSRKPLSSILLLAIYYATLPLLLGFIIGSNKVSVTLIIAITAIWTIQKFSISLLKDYKDIKGDKKYGKQTFLLKYGPSMVNNISMISGVICYVLAVITLFLFSEINLIGMAIIAGIALICTINRLELNKNEDSEKLNKIFQKSFLLDNYFNLAVLVCLIRF